MQYPGKLRVRISSPTARRQRRHRVHRRRCHRRRRPSAASRDMNQSQFHAKNPLTEAEQRPTTEVFKSAAGQSEGFKSRFASTGNFTSAQLEEGADVDAAGVPEEPEAGVRSVLAALYTHACGPHAMAMCACVAQSLMTTGPSTRGSRSKRTPSKRSGSTRTRSKTRRGPDFSPPPR